MLSPEEKKEIQEIFGKSLESLDLETFEKLHKEQRLKYHPDKFEQYDDEVVKELANRRFQRIEALAEKVKPLLKGDKQVTSPQEDIFQEDAQFAFEGMKIEIITKDKDLKYRLFGTRYRWLERGDKFKVPNTEAKIIMDEGHRGNRIGFNETIRMYLSFTESDSLFEITKWLFQSIAGQADALIIQGKRIPVDLQEMMTYIMRKSFLRLGDGASVEE